MCFCLEAVVCLIVCFLLLPRWRWFAHAKTRMQRHWTLCSPFVRFQLFRFAACCAAELCALCCHLVGQEQDSQRPRTAKAGAVFFFWGGVLGLFDELVLWFIFFPIPFWERLLELYNKSVFCFCALACYNTSREWQLASEVWFVGCQKFSRRDSN